MTKKCVRVPYDHFRQAKQNLKSMCKAKGIPCDQKTTIVQLTEILLSSLAKETSTPFANKKKAKVTEESPETEDKGKHNPNSFNDPYSKPAQHFVQEYFQGNLDEAKTYCLKNTFFVKGHKKTRAMMPDMRNSKAGLKIRWVMAKS